jgi:hypothetical protein
VKLVLLCESAAGYGNISDEIESSLDAYIRQQEAAPSLTAVIRAALKEYLARSGFAPGRKLRITPANKGSGVRDASIEHDHYPAGR